MTADTRHDPPRRAAREQGTASVQFAIGSVALLLLWMFAAAIGMAAKANATMESVAAAAARAASISRTAAQAQSDAAEAAAATMTQQGLHCAASSTDVDLSGFSAPPGTPAFVTANVSCTVDTSRLGVASVAFTRTVRASAVSPIDTYRARS